VWWSGMDWCHDLYLGLDMYLQQPVLQPMPPWELDAHNNHNKASRHNWPDDDEPSTDFHGIKS